MSHHTIEYKIIIPRTIDMYTEKYGRRYKGTRKLQKQIEKFAANIFYIKRQFAKSKIQITQEIVFDQDCRGYMILKSI